MISQTSLKQYFFTPSRGQFALWLTFAIVLLNNWPVAAYVATHLGLASWAGWQTLITIAVVIVVFTYTSFTLVTLLSIRLAKVLATLFLLTNACALYFLNTYQVILDKTMIGNILNTQTSESSQYLSFTLLLYVLLLGVLPSWWLWRMQVSTASRWRLATQWLVGMGLSIVWIWSASATWLWIDKHGKALGGTILPWSYIVNSALYYQDYAALHVTQTPLADGSFTNQEKTVVVLVIGESARAENFSMYGYARNTNPKTSQSGAVAMANTRACASYTTAAVACILAHTKEKSFGKVYETLPTYLQRQGVEVIWRSKNWGEAPITVSSYLTSKELKAQCQGIDCNYDGVLLAGLKEQIENATADKVFVVLHQTGSHGPAYNKKYPPEFEHFTPVCDSVELSKCSSESLLNAYDNTILYNDDFLARLTQTLQSLSVQSSAYLYLSDHGESLGENGLYLHGTPYSLAPKQQLEIPFIVWMSDAFQRQHQVQPQQLRDRPENSQDEIFHSVMGALGLTSEFYRPDLDIFNQ
ncbi:phosphoethanolamine--lipid A transferase EptA [Maribrevibacterium harenarium]|uniref:Phosphoethanolamine--lipid A transferase EptA n=1 Tax=Maribrevibacterium harenarium TaxID=2589817 RepID=A0A501X3Y5_9GAMM|nr:phosphoethanolamine--lipid A transferase EptA [Maribrevibacterium harenarium]TPE55222.1 phosphoethanolamine--lipid A transferase EptA [Maribrevibacterium harenarium]